MFKQKLYDAFDRPLNRENTESEKWDDRAAFGNAKALPLWVADMDFATVPEVIQGLSERTAHGAFGYNMSLARDKDALISWFSRRHDLSLTADSILFCPGVVDGIYHVLTALFDKGNRIVVQPPVYGPFFSMPKKAGMQVVENPLICEGGLWRMDLEGLEEIFKDGADALVLCSPHNPVGRIWTQEELKALCALCDRYGVTLISDEIHCDFELEGKHTCLLSLEAEKAVQLVSATKTFNLAALRHSAILCRDRDMLVKIKAQLDSAMVDVNLYGKLATRLAYENGDDWLDTLLVYLRENRDAMTAALGETGLLKLFPLQGTYLLWVDCTALGLGNEDLNRFFIQKAGVIPSEGTFFGTQGEGFIRLNLATQHACIREAADRINAALKAL